MAEASAVNELPPMPYEWEWAREYELSLLPPGTRFPKQGDTYECIESTEVTYITAWNVPFTGGGKTTLKVGTRIFVSEEPSSETPISINADAVDYKALESAVVPAAERSSPNYSGFSLLISTHQLNTSFRLVDGVD